MQAHLLIQIQSWEVQRMMLLRIKKCTGDLWEELFIYLN